MTIEQPSATAGLIERAKNIIMTPRAEWDRIAPEPANQSGILMGYVLPLAGLSAVAGAVGQAVFGIGAFGFHVSVPPVAAAVGGVIALVMSLLMLFVFSFVLNMLAPNFGSQKDAGQAFKLAAYSCTAGWLAGLFAIYPPLSALGILGLYSLVLLYLGMPRLMKTPEDKRVGYFIATIVVCIIAGIIISVVFGAVRAAIPGMGVGPNPFSAMGAQSSSSSDDDVQIKIGGSTIDVGDAEKAAKQMEQAFGGMTGEGGSVQAAVSPATLQALLPDSLPGGFARSSVSSAEAMGASQAEAEYTSGDRRIKVQVMHMGAMGAMMGMAAAAGVQANEETADGFSRTRTVDGRVYNEAMSRSAGTVSYAIIGKNGATISVEGSGGVTGDQATAVLNAINISRLEALGT